MAICGCVTWHANLILNIKCYLPGSKRNNAHNCLGYGIITLHGMEYKRTRRLLNTDTQHYI